MKKVMLVEDEDWILMGLKNILDWEELGFLIVHTAHNGQEALDMWAEVPVDIVVTDVNMPLMDGLTLLKRLREMDGRVQFIILTGYDEFEYARTALRLGVEEYILKPINEEDLQEALVKAGEKLDAMDGEKFAHIKERTALTRFLEGKEAMSEAGEFMAPVFELLEKAPSVCVLMTFDMDSLPPQSVAAAFTWLSRGKDGIVVFPVKDDSLLVFFSCPDPGKEVVRQMVAELQEILEERFGLLTFAGISPCFTVREEVPAAYEAARKLQKYRLVEGFGGFVDRDRILGRETMDIAVDDNFLSRLILKKDKAGTLRYLDDLFINNVKAETNADAIYQMAVKVVMLLQQMKQEYHLTDSEGLLELSELVSRIWQAGNLGALKAVLARETADMIDCLHTADSQYTPVIRQILADVERDYKGDMNLKTLAHKYHMNTSYLGQVFQKEVGLSFSQYLTNKKNSRAKELILTTNRKISEVAEEVGYPDTSYFYRKFKQTYGVSPTTLRDMQKF